MLGGDAQGLFDRHDPELLALIADQAHFFVKDLFVDLMNSVCDCEHLRKMKSSDARHPSAKTQ